MCTEARNLTCNRDTSRCSGTRAPTVGASRCDRMGWIVPPGPHVHPPNPFVQVSYVVPVNFLRSSKPVLILSGFCSFALHSGIDQGGSPAVCGPYPDSDVIVGWHTYPSSLYPSSATTSVVRFAEYNKYVHANVAAPRIHIVKNVMKTTLGVEIKSNALSS
eukprot:29122-Pelagococcus_subviridis.AAC.4